MSEGNVKNLIHTPAEMITGYVQWAERAQSDPGIPFGVKAIDDQMIPMKPGDLVSVLGRPGDGKTSILAYLAKQEAKRIKARGADGEVVVYVTWEQSCEELTAFFMAGTEYSVSDVAWGRVNIDQVKRQAARGADMPIWVIGHGIYRAGEKTPRMTPDVVLAAIESMQDEFGVRPTLMLFDYLQLVPIPSASRRVDQVTEAPIRIKEVALRVGAPAVVGVQAHRSVDDRNVKLAEQNDAQWSSAIEQTSDKMFSLWRPARTEEMLGNTIEMESGQRYKVTPTLMLIRMIKQRFAQGRQTWAMHFDPAYLRLAELELRTVSLDEPPPF